MSWWTTAPVFLACIMVMVLPGLVLALCLGLRRVLAVGIAPAFSVGIAAVAAVLAPFLGLRWNVWVLIGFTIVVSGAALLILRIKPLRRMTRTSGQSVADRWPVSLSAAAGVAIGGIIIARQAVGLIGNPQNIAQRFDNVFHLNAVRFIIENGNASTLNLGAVTSSTGRGAIYPAAWHSFAALIADATGAGVPEAVNVVNVTIAAVVWPVSMILLTRVVAGARPIALLATGILTAGFIAFPFLMMVWGPLFPYMLSVALLPAALAVTVLLVDMGRDTDTLAKPVLVVALLVAMAGIALSHMSSINTLLLLTLPIVMWAAGRDIRILVRTKAQPKAFVLVTAAAAAYIGVFLVLWLKLRPEPYDVWQPHQTPAGAIGEALANSPMNFQEVPVIVTVLGLAGLITVVRSVRDAWIGVAFVLLAYLYVVDAAFDRGPLRSVLTGIWYADTNRLAALLPLVSTLLGALAVASLWDAAARGIAKLEAPSSSTLMRQPTSTPAKFLGITGAALVAVVLASGVQSSALSTYLSESE